jgi:hypothetical protein
MCFVLRLGMSSIRLVVDNFLGVLLWGSCCTVKYCVTKKGIFLIFFFEKFKARINQWLNVLLVVVKFLNVGAQKKIAVSTL